MEHLARRSGVTRVVNWHTIQGALVRDLSQLGAPPLPCERKLSWIPKRLPQAEMWKDPHRRYYCVVSVRLRVETLALDEDAKSGSGWIRKEIR